MLPSITTLFQQMIIQPTTLFKGGFQGFNLLLIQKESVLKRFTHGNILEQIRTFVTRQEYHPTHAALKGTRNAPDIPMAEARGFTARFGKIGTFTRWL
ncbi:MAG: hypothetical protein ABI396_03715 [Ktedonobacteraceae bacterium]